MPASNSGASLVGCLSLATSRTAYYRSLHELASEPGLFWDEVLKAWVITRFETCQRLLHDRSLARSAVTLPDALPRDLRSFAIDVLGSQMMYRDGPVAEARRKSWMTALIPGDTHWLRPLASEHLFRAASSGTDLYTDILRPFVSRVIAHQLGVSRDAMDALYPHVCRVVDFFDGRVASLDAVTAALGSLATVYSRLSMHLGLWPSAAYEADDHAWLCDALLVLIAGHESSAFLTATAFLHASPDVQSADLVTEASRFDSPVQLVGRLVPSDRQIDSVHVKGGDRLLLHLGAANHDPATYETPGQFLPGRARKPLAFGSGAGACIGRSLALRSSSLMLDLLRASPLEIDREGIRRRDGLAGCAYGTVPLVVSPELK